MKRKILSSIILLMTCVCLVLASADPVSAQGNGLIFEEVHLIDKWDPDSGEESYFTLSISGVNNSSTKLIDPCANMSPGDICASPTNDYESVGTAQRGNTLRFHLNWSGFSAKYPEGYKELTVTLETKDGTYCGIGSPRAYLLDQNEEAKRKRDAEYGDTYDSAYPWLTNISQTDSELIMDILAPTESEIEKIYLNLQFRGLGIEYFYGEGSCKEAVTIDLTGPSSPAVCPAATQTIKATAQVNPGEDAGTDVFSEIIEGLKKLIDNFSREALAGTALVSIGGALATAGALSASSGGKDKGDKDKKEEEKKKKTYKMKVKKDFGDTIRLGEVVTVYAKIVEIDEDGEHDRPDLTKNIIIQSHDEIFITQMQEDLSGNYKAAQVQVTPDLNFSNEGEIDFIYQGYGGTFTNSVTFKAKMPGITFYQKNIALAARDERGAAIGFTVEGFDLEKLKIDLKFTEGSSYTAAVVQGMTEEGEKVPDTYFAVIGDINSDEGQPGSYVVHRLQVHVYDEKFSAEEEFEIYRVTMGLYVGAEVLNCYRMLKKEAAGKDVDELTKSDFDISYTKVPVMIINVDEEAHEIFYTPAMPEIKIMPLDEEDSLMKERLEGIGLEAKPVEVNNGITEYVIYCSKGWLEPPFRLKARLTAKAVDEETGKVYTCEKTVALISQPIREKISISQLENDDKVREWIFNVQDTIEKVDELMDELCSEYMLMTTLWMGYDEKFGYDPITIAMLQKNVELGIFRAKRKALKDKQDMNLRIQETAHHDDNFWTNVSKSFAMVSDEKLDTWQGVAARIALGFFTGGLSEIPFNLMDANRAVSRYNESTLLCDRTWKNKLIAGATPVVVSYAVGAYIGAGIKYVSVPLGALKEVILPPNVRAACGKWVINATQKMIKKIPEKYVNIAKEYINLGKDIKKALGELADDINAYDPRKYLYGVRRSAAEAKSLNEGAKKLAQKNAIDIRNGKRTLKGQVMDEVEAACELQSARDLDDFKRAYDRFLVEGTKESREAFEKAFWKMEKNSFNLNKLNADGKTAWQIAQGKKVKIPNKYRAAYNEWKAKLADDPALKLMKKKAAEYAHVSEDQVIISRATGKTAEEIGEGFTSSYDTDNSILISDPKKGTTYYLSQEMTEEIGARSYCEATGFKYTTLEEAKKYCADRKWEFVSPNSPEYYMQFDRFKPDIAFDDYAIKKNMMTGEFKLTHGYMQMDKQFEKLIADSVKRERVVKELKRFTNREISGLSQETLEYTYALEKAKDAMHQGPKTFDLYVSKDVHGQAFGLKSGFSDQSRLTVETLRLVENQGQYHMTIGELHDLLALNGTTYREAVHNMTLDFKTVNTNCRTANYIQSSFWWDTTPKSNLDGVISAVETALTSGLDQPQRKDQ